MVPELGIVKQPSREIGPAESAFSFLCVCFCGLIAARFGRHTSLRLRQRVVQEATLFLTRK